MISVSSTLKTSGTGFCRFLRCGDSLRRSGLDWENLKDEDEMRVRKCMAFTVCTARKDEKDF